MRSPEYEFRRARVLLPAALLVVAAIARLSAVQAAEPAAPVSFSKDLAPILVLKCLACHGVEKAKGGYHIQTFEALLKPGSSKEAPIVPGKPKESKIYQLLTATDPDDRMPQKDDALPEPQLRLFERWITEGARFDGPSPKAELTAIVPQRVHPDPPVAYPRPIPVVAMAFRPDGKELATGGYYEVTIWDPATGKLLRRIKNLPQRIQCLTYSPDGTILAAAGGLPGKAGEVKLLDPAKGNAIRLLAQHADVVLALAFDPSGKRLAAGGSDNTIRVYDMATGQRELLIEQHADWVMGLSFNHDGTRLASASRDKSVRVFDAGTGELLQSDLDHGEPVYDVAFGPDDKLVFSAGRARKIRAWNPDSAQESKSSKKSGRSRDITGFEDDILRIAVANGHIFSAGVEKKLREHDASTGELVRTYEGHADFIYSIAADPTSKRIATGSYDGQIRIWSTEDGHLTTSFVAAPGFPAQKN